MKDPVQEELEEGVLFILLVVSIVLVWVITKEYYDFYGMWDTRSPWFGRFLPPPSPWLA